MSKLALYQNKLPKNPQAITFVNGVIARDQAGFFWIWRNLNRIRRSTEAATGCIQVKSGICSATEILMVSYWESEKHLMDFFRSTAHRDMMKFNHHHPQSLCMYNEMYGPTKSGKYSHEPQGMALIYSPQV